jgi:hypothetical protein
MALSPPRPVWQFLIPFSRSERQDQPGPIERDALGWFGAFSSVRFFLGGWAEDFVEVDFKVSKFVGGTIDSTMCRWSLRLRIRSSYRS